MDTSPIRKFEAYKGNAPYIFISYAHKDAEVVYPILNEMHAQGYNIWYDEGIDPGNEWPDEIACALEKCAFFIVFISMQSIRSRNVLDEIYFSLDEKKPFLAIHIEETVLPAGLRLRIGSTQAIFKYNMTSESFYSKLFRVLEGRSLNAKTIEIPVRGILGYIAKGDNAPKQGDILVTHTGTDNGVDVIAGDKCIAKGDVVVVDEHFAIRVSEFDKGKTSIAQNDGLILELGRTTKTVGQLLELAPGSIIEFNQRSDAPVKVYDGDKCIAAGDLVVVEGCFAVRVRDGQDL